MELLAPAGTVETFFAALENGADAVYLGLKAFSARAYAANFTLAQVSSLAQVSRQRGCKLYVALNALVKEEERPELMETLGALQEIGPDALIIQDLGVYYLVRQHYPALPVHASTLLTIHNSLGVAQAAAMGFKRVVLARELTLSELAAIRRQTRLELEVFIHGALCYSFSGLCLFSSYLGGRAATRGRCTQPCRRLYHYRQESGYILSLSDLSGLELVPQLQTLGIEAIKIEGRMKSGEYVSRVVRAYRLVMDASLGDQKQAIAGAQELLARTYSRRTTSGFFKSPHPQGLLAPEDTGNIGLLLGKIDRSEESWATLRLLESLSVGDRLRLQAEATGERRAFTLKELQFQGQMVDMARAGDEVRISLPDPAQTGDLLYKVGETTPGGSRSEKKWLEYLYSLAQPAKLTAKLDKKLRLPENLGHPKKTKDHRSHRPFVYIRTRSCLEALELHRQKQGPLLVDLTEANFNEYLGQPRQARVLSGFIWSLPPIMFEGRLVFFRQAVQTLIQGGARQFMVSNLGHFQLLREVSAHLPRLGRSAAPKAKAAGRLLTEEARDREPGSAAEPEFELTLYSDYPLHCLNLSAFQALKQLAVSYMTLSMEADRRTLQLLLRQAPSQRLMTYLYSYPNLMISRAPLPEGKKALRLISPLGERFRLTATDGLTCLAPTVPLLWQKPLPELQSLGLHRFIIDLNRSGLPVSQVGDLKRRLLLGPVISGGMSMNYYRGLE
ncbi:peptidase U32 family protein [Desulfobacca acetoxidans]|uniref:Peptidase U32 n=1 Tax=Desulfobacca acetoxidans (strain ATCC 700848 / DSM 11109 / ASRB2) TaxID=880072 RepID=F2NID2_DESAR|nr:peptidase U32 family protein [Desulfobacca acetoxidans]AEB10334.1 peptidase U32 [Desulfobacca acetoxidans DSM 11109]